jgi:CHASE2 domain-containing sensor protein
MHPLLSSLLQRLSSARSVILLLTASVVIAHLTGVPLLDALESKSYDMRLLATASHKVPEQVAIVAIDEKSLNAVGRWPWSRSKIAELTDRINQAGAAVIAFDILFSEPENAQLIAQMDKLERDNGAGQDYAYRNLRTSLNTDEALARTLRNTDTSVLPVVFMWTDEETRHIRSRDALRSLEGLLPNAIKTVRTRDNVEPLLNSPDPRGLTINIPQLQAAAHASGHINISPDADGTLRRVALAVRYQGRYFPAADLQAARMLLGSPELALNTASYGITGLELGKRAIPTDEEGNILINYYGSAQTVPTVSAIDVLEGNANSKLLKDRVVLLGSTAKGIGDIRVTPYSPVFPGVEVRATVVQNLLDGSFRYRPEWLQLAEAAVLLLCGLLLAFVLPRLNLRHAAMLCATLFVITLAIAISAFQNHLWVNLVYPSLLFLLTFVANALMQHKADRR